MAEPNNSAGGEVDEERLQREIEDQREKDLEEGRQRAVKQRRKRARAERSSSEARSFTTDTRERGPSVDDFLQPGAARDYRESTEDTLLDTSEPSLYQKRQQHHPYSRYSEPLMGRSEDFDFFDAMGHGHSTTFMPPTPRSQLPPLGYQYEGHSSLYSALGSSFYGTSLSPLRATSFPASVHREALGSENANKDLLQKIQGDISSEYKWPLSARAQSMPVDHLHWGTSSPGAHPDYDTHQLRQLLEGNSKQQSFSSLGQTALRSSSQTKYGGQHDQGRSYTLQPQEEVQCAFALETIHGLMGGADDVAVSRGTLADVYLTRDQAADTQRMSTSFSFAQACMIADGADDSG